MFSFRKTLFLWVINVYIIADFFFFKEYYVEIHEMEIEITKSSHHLFLAPQENTNSLIPKKYFQSTSHLFFLKLSIK